MKQLDNYIQEKLKLDKNIGSTKYTFKPIENDIKPFWGYNWILNNGHFDTCYTFLKYALDNLILTPNEEDFINDFVDDIEEYYKKNGNKVNYSERTEIINGKINNGYYKRPKCIYDIAKYMHDNKIRGLKDKFGNKLDDEPENILFDLENLTNNDIKKLDWPH